MHFYFRECTGAWYVCLWVHESAAYDALKKMLDHLDLWS